MNIRKSIEADKTEIINVHVEAFGKEKGPEIGQCALVVMKMQRRPGARLEHVV